MGDRANISEREEYLREIDRLQNENLSLQSLLNRETDMKLSAYDGPVVNDLHKTVSNLEKKLKDKHEEMMTILNEQQILREENSKLRLNNYRFETEKTELE